MSTTDPETRLYKKSAGTGAVLCFIGRALMENRHGLVVQGDLTQADGHAVRCAALEMVQRHSPGEAVQYGDTNQKLRDLTVEVSRHEPLAQQFHVVHLRFDAASAVVAAQSSPERAAKIF